MPQAIEYETLRRSDPVIGFWQMIGKTLSLLSAVVFFGTLGTITIGAVIGLVLSAIENPFGVGTFCVSVVVLGWVWSFVVSGLRLERRRQRKDQGVCVNCAYNLLGLTEGRCPECGTPFDLPAPNVPFPRTQAHPS